MCKNAFRWKTFFKALPLIIWGAVALVQVMKSEGGFTLDELGEIAGGLSSLGHGGSEGPAPPTHQKEIE